MTRLWVSGWLITVDLDKNGLPIRFMWQDRPHPIKRIANQWRVDLEWWRGRIWRDYFLIVTHTGLLVILFHDLIYQQWFLQRLYD